MDWARDTLRTTLESGRVDATDEVAHRRPHVVVQQAAGKARTWAGSVSSSCSP